MDECQIAEAAVADEVESESDEASRAEDRHLADVNDGCGCTEVWEHLSENRADE
jgi:hypothetical protein